MNKKTKTKKLELIIFLILFGLALLFGVWYYNTWKHSAYYIDGSNRSGQTTVDQFGQKLSLHYTTTYSNGPTQTMVYLFLSGQNSGAVELYSIRGEFTMPSISLIYNLNSLKCYEWLSASTCFITYKTGDSNVKAYPNIFFDQSDYRLLYPVAKQEFMTKDWRRVHSFAEILLKNNDAEAREILQRYASGSFTTEEIDQNEKSNSVTPNQIQTFSYSLLLKYK